MSESPSDVYQSIGDEIGDLLQQAHDWATRTRAEAEAEATRLTEEAAATAKRVVDEAKANAEQLGSESAERAEQLRSESEEFAKRVRSESEERAERVRSESQMAATKLRTSAEGYASQIRSDAESDAKREVREAEARVAELSDIETQARQRIDSLMKRLLKIAEQLGEDVRDNDIIEKSSKLEIPPAEQPQQEQPHDDLRVEVVHQDDDEPIGVESERLAAGGAKG
jgi:regulator of protease activity HflC (stomatin/prohibitin superfamily)